MDRAVLRSVVIGSVLVVGGVVAAQQAADVSQVVRDIEHNEFRFDDITYTMKIKLIEAGETTREIEFQVYAKGSDKMLIKITAPGEVAGTAILQLGPRTMYMYNPEDRSVRLIAASARAQGLLGTDYAAADASLVGIGDGWTNTLLETTDAFYKVQSVPESGDVSPYSKLVIWYDREEKKATKIEYYLDGSLAKTINREEFVHDGGVFNDFTHTTVNNARADRVTDVRITDTEVNTGLDDRLFTKRNLMLGE
ncbi:MAG: outer membrane lipoprotein-sorting protein [Deltaproteobacteria bacterium]|nr:outer membrane lipoprotein-sorting protein [Deltaproteobacteria bacterium]